MQTTAITKFEGKHRWCSNFAEGTTVFRGITFRYRENAYQWAKGLLGGEDLTSRKMRLFHEDVIDEHGILSKQYTPFEAKKWGKKLLCPADWDEDTVKGAVMKEIVLDCFKRNAGHRILLLDTDTVLLEEGNNWHDTYFGVCNGTCWKGPHPSEGRNMLGKILMEVREELRTVCV